MLVNIVASPKKAEKKKQAEHFYKKVLEILTKSEFPFLIGGTFAVRQYTGIERSTKDMDIFCKYGDYPRILRLMSEHGYKTLVHDSRWIAKIYQDKNYADIIFATASGLWAVDDSWFLHNPTTEVLGVRVKLISPEDMIWCRAYIQARDRYDGADIHHMILRKGKDLDWKRLLNRIEIHWELLLAHLINFSFVYPSERDIIPKWLMKELLNRAQDQLDLPKPKDKTCRGPLLSHDQYEIDTEKWGFKTITLNLPSK